MSTQVEGLVPDYPWLKTPIVVSAPMRLIALAELTVEVSKAGGLGFIGAGSDVSDLEGLLEGAKRLLKGSSLSTNNGQLPLGVGLLNWGASMSDTVPLIAKYRPAAVWFFAPHKPSDLTPWSAAVRAATDGKTKIWIQIGTVAEAVEVYDSCRPDVLVVQGGDAGGHGLNSSASIITLLPETADTLQNRLDHGATDMPTLVAAGGIMDGRGVAAASALGAAGVVLGTRLLAAHEANITKGYLEEVLRASDGGPNTVRTSVYDQLRGTTEWPTRYGGRGIINRSFVDAQAGMRLQENVRLYQEETKKGDKGWGVEGRMTTYAGTGIGLVRKAQSAKDIVEEVRQEARDVMRRESSAKL